MLTWHEILYPVYLIRPCRVDVLYQLNIFRNFETVVAVKQMFNSKRFGRSVPASKFWGPSFLSAACFFGFSNGKELDLDVYSVLIVDWPVGFR